MPTKNRNKPPYTVEEQTDTFLIKEHINVDDRQSTLIVKAKVDENKKGQITITMKLTTVQISRDDKVRKAVIQNVGNMLDTACIEALNRRDVILKAISSGDPDQMKMFGMNPDEDI